MEEKKQQRERLVARAKKLHDAKKYHVEFKKVRCRAIDDGYYNGRVIRYGQVFTYDDILKNGKLPRWCEAVDELKTEWSELSDAEKAPYLSNSESTVVADSGVSRELELIRKEREAEKALRQEAEARLSKSEEIIPAEPSPLPASNENFI